MQLTHMIVTDYAAVFTVERKRPLYYVIFKRPLYYVIFKRKDVGWLWNPLYMT